QALAPPAQASLAVAGDEAGNLGSGMGSGGSSMSGARTGGGGGLVGGATGAVTSTAGGAVNSAGNTAGSVGSSTTAAVAGPVKNTWGAAARGPLSRPSHGGVGLRGLAWNPATTGSAQGSVISSTTRNVKLDGGTQMVLQVTGSAAAH